MSSVRPTYDSIECHSCLVHLFVYACPVLDTGTVTVNVSRRPMVGRQFSM
jgi:hypothetical protein